MPPTSKIMFDLQAPFTSTAMSNTICDHDMSDSGKTITIENYDVVEATIPPAKSCSNSQDHAHIVPVNRQAKLAFHEVAHVLRYRPGLIPHASKFMHVNEHQSALPGDVQGRKLWTGHYCLNLAVPPKNLARGWVIGTGQLGSNCAEVDIMVSVFGQLDDVCVRHARILYHRSSRVLMLKSLPGRVVILNGREIFDQPYTLSTVCMGLTIGNLTYRIEFPQIDSQLYRQQLDLLMNASDYWGRSGSNSLKLTPSDSHYDLRGYQIQSPQAAGTYGVVSACLKKSTGNVYAAKRVQRTKQSFSLVKDELAILELVGKHPHICSLVETLYSDGDRTSLGPTTINDVHMILDPYAPETLDALKSTQNNKGLILHAFHQIAQGLSHIHSRGIIHRDIKPNNILIAARHPLRIVIADFGHATTERASTDHLKGTLTYLAPEILSLKPNPTSKGGWSIPGTWTPASDIYSLGVIGFELFHRTFRRRNSVIDTTQHRSLMTELRRQSNSVDPLLREMIAAHPRDRPNIDAVLSRNLWMDKDPGCGKQDRKRDCSVLDE